MKRWLALLLATFPLLGQDDYQAQFDVVPPTPPPLFPFSVSGSYLNVANADFHTPQAEGEHMHYAQYDTGISYTQPLSCVWGLIFGAGWIGNTVNWQENPYFDETDFNYINGQIGAFTKAYPDWTWTATLGFFFDTEKFSLADYTLYQLAVWGKYDWFDCLEFDVGFIFEAGLDKQKVWPILGFVWNPSDLWHINCVYPILINIKRDFLKYWSVGAGLQFLRNRHRVGENEPNPQCIFEYRTWGYEGILSFSPLKNLYIVGYGGSTFRGDFKITNRSNKHGEHFKFDAAPYAGIDAVLSF